MLITDQTDQGIINGPQLSFIRHIALHYITRLFVYTRIHFLYGPIHLQTHVNMRNVVSVLAL